MKISLITVCRNSAGFIRMALDSVLAQSGVDLDYQIVDGGSTDGTQDLLRECEPAFRGRMKWTSEPDQGLYDAINKGIQRATGDVVGILNADDFFAHGKVLEKVAGAFAEPAGDHLEAVYGDVCFVRSNNVKRIVRYYSGRLFQPWMLRWGFMPPHPTFYCRREWFERLGRYHLDYPIGADYELLIRFLWRSRLRTRYLPGPMVVMRTGGTSTRSWRSNLTLNRDIVRACRTNGIYTNLAMLMPKYLFKVFEFARRGAIRSLRP